MIKIYHTQSEVDADIKDGVLKVDSDVRFEFSLKVEARLEINGDISAWNITARDINARDINTANISAGDIIARDIIAGEIIAGNISFHAVCFAYHSFVCKSIKGRRENAKYFCLDKEVEVKNP